MEVEKKSLMKGIISFEDRKRKKKGRKMMRGEWETVFMCIMINH